MSVLPNTLGFHHTPSVPEERRTTQKEPPELPTGTVPCTSTGTPKQCTQSYLSITRRSHNFTVSLRRWRHSAASKPSRRILRYSDKADTVGMAPSLYVWDYEGAARRRLRGTASSAQTPATPSSMMCLGKESSCASTAPTSSWSSAVARPWSRSRARGGMLAPSQIATRDRRARGPRAGPARTVPWIVSLVCR